MMFKKALITAAMLAAVAGAQAQAANFGVTGTITPAACTLTLTGGGVADYGSVPSATVKLYGTVNNNYVMGNRTIPFAVNCNAQTPLELAFTDNKAAQRIDVYPSYTQIGYGIADGAGTTAIGGYNFFMNTVVVDGTAAAGLLTAPTGTNTWTTSLAQYPGPGSAYGFMKTAGQTAPSPLTTVTGNLMLTAHVSKPYVDAATTAITMNGSGTITLQYL